MYKMFTPPSRPHAPPSRLLLPSPGSRTSKIKNAKTPDRADEGRTGETGTWCFRESWTPLPLIPCPPSFFYPKVWTALVCQYHYMCRQLLLLLITKNTSTLLVVCERVTTFCGIKIIVHLDCSFFLTVNRTNTWQLDVHDQKNLKKKMAIFAMDAILYLLTLAFSFSITAIWRYLFLLTRYPTASLLLPAQQRPPKGGQKKRSHTPDSSCLLLLAFLHRFDNFWKRFFGFGASFGAACFHSDMTKHTQSDSRPEFCPYGPHFLPVSLPLLVCLIVNKVQTCPC